MFTNTFPSTREKSYAKWLHIPCPITDRIVLSGALPETTEGEQKVLAQWRALGVTDYLDTRIEENETEHFRKHIPDITYHWAGAPDDLGQQLDSWWQRGIDVATRVLADPNRVLMVTCAAGVSRSPSMVLAILLTHGWAPADALSRIRERRPCSVITYSQQAVEWFHRNHNLTRTDAKRAIREVRNWHGANPLTMRDVVPTIWDERNEV